MNLDRANNTEKITVIIFGLALRIGALTKNCLTLFSFWFSVSAVFLYNILIALLLSLYTKQCRNARRSKSNGDAHEWPAAGVSKQSTHYRKWYRYNNTMLNWAEVNGIDAENSRNRSYGFNATHNCITLSCVACINVALCSLFLKLEYKYTHTLSHESILYGWFFFCNFLMLFGISFTVRFHWQADKKLAVVMLVRYNQIKTQRQREWERGGRARKKEWKKSGSIALQRYPCDCIQIIWANIYTNIRT